MSLVVDTNVLETPTFLGDVVLELSDKFVHAVNDRKLEASEREVSLYSNALNDTTRSWTRREQIDAQRQLNDAIKRRDFIARTMP